MLVGVPINCIGRRYTKRPIIAHDTVCCPLHVRNSSGVYVAALEGKFSPIDPRVTHCDAGRAGIVASAEFAE